MIVRDVFEHVEQHDGVVRARRGRSVELGRDHDGVGMVLQPLSQRSAVRLRRFERGEVSVLGKVRRVRAPPCSDLEDPSADVRTDQVQDPRRVVLGLSRSSRTSSRSWSAASNVAGVRCERSSDETGFSSWSTASNTADERVTRSHDSCSSCSVRGQSSAMVEASSNTTTSNPNTVQVVECSRPRWVGDESVADLASHDQPAESAAIRATAAAPATSGRLTSDHRDTDDGGRSARTSGEMSGHASTTSAAGSDQRSPTADRMRRPVGHRRVERRASRCAPYRARSARHTQAQRARPGPSRSTSFVAASMSWSRSRASRTGKPPAVEATGDLSRWTEVGGTLLALANRRCTPRRGSASILRGSWSRLPCAWFGCAAR